jgi:hypothetical protein
MMPTMHSGTFAKKLKAVLEPAIFPFIMPLLKISVFCIRIEGI